MKYLSIEIYEILICGFIGMLLQMLMKARSIQAKARLANLQFKFREYFTDDWLSHMISTGAVVLFTILVRRRLEHIPVNMYELVLAFAATVGYGGADIVSRFFSFTNKRINAGIDFKATQSDKSQGLDPTVPTPATKP